MLLNSLQTSAAAALNADPYFYNAAGPFVLWDGQKEDSDKKQLATADAIEDLLDSLGIAGVVSEIEVTPLDNFFAVAQFSIVFIENIARNRGPNGTGKTANNFAEAAWGILLDQFFAPWSPIQFDGLVPAKVNREGFTAWELQLRCQTLIDKLYEIIADESGNTIIDPNGTPLEVTPTS